MQIEKQAKKGTSTREKMVLLVAELLSVKHEKVTDGARFVDDLGADSLDMVETTASLENEFEISIIDDETDKIITFGDALRLVESKIKETKKIGNA